MFSKLKSYLQDLHRDTSGVVNAEAVIVMPVLFWLFGVGWVYFDAFRQHSINQKANFVIGDMIARETQPLTSEYMDSAFQLLKLLDQSYGDEADLRISVVAYDGNNGRWNLNWSQARGAQSPLRSVQAITDRLPAEAAHTDQLIIVETWEDYAPAFKVGLGAFEIKTYSFTRPRFTPQVLYQS
jgi:hypothetical protein